MTNTARRARQPRGWGGRDATQAQSYISVYVYTYIYIYIYIIYLFLLYASEIQTLSRRTGRTTTMIRATLVRAYDDRA